MFEELRPEMRTKVVKFSEKNVVARTGAIPPEGAGTSAEAIGRRALAVFAAIEGRSRLIPGRRVRKTLSLIMRCSVGSNCYPSLRCLGRAGRDDLRPAAQPSNDQYAGTTLLPSDFRDRILRCIRNAASTAWRLNAL